MRLVAHEGAVAALAINSTGDVLASGSSKSTVKIWAVTRAVQGKVGWGCCRWPCMHGRSHIVFYYPHASARASSLLGSAQPALQVEPRSTALAQRAACRPPIEPQVELVETLDAAHDSGVAGLQFWPRDDGKYEWLASIGSSYKTIKVR